MPWPIPSPGLGYRLGHPLPRCGRGALGNDGDPLHFDQHFRSREARDGDQRACGVVVAEDFAPQLREAVANANQCRYCTAHQKHQLQGLGIPEAKIAAIGMPDDGAFSRRERAAVRFAQAMTIDAGAIPPAVYADFIAEFTPQERVEVTIVATAMGMLNKINDALRVPLESEFEELVS